MLNSFQVSSITAFALNLLLGIAVYLMNPGRRANRCFLITSLAIASWLCCFMLVPFASGREDLLRLMRYSGVASGVLPMAFDLLRHSIMHETEKRRDLLRTLMPWFFTIPAVTLISFHASFVLDVDMSRAGFPMPIHGHGQVLYAIISAGTVLLFAKRFISDFRSAQGIKREELGFNVLASVLFAISALSLGQVVPAVTGQRQVLSRQGTPVILG